jgi:glyoxylase-like metal-dependent hydrolase (beta-lactamase superfamily II)
MKMRQIAEGIFMLSNPARLCSNAYALEAENKDKKLLIDAGDGSLKFDFEPVKCILTHGHMDHTNGVGPGWKDVRISAKENPAAEFVFIPKNARHIDFKELEFGNFFLEVIETPGHTPGSVCLFEHNTGLLFSGDTKFANGGYGRTDIGGSEKELMKSLELIESLDYTVLCPGHGDIEEREG